MKNTKDFYVAAPHDKGYKKDLSNPKEFLHFLKKYVGADWTKDLMVNQLILCDKEFIEKDYEGREADLLYRVSKSDGTDMYIYVLQELQSYVDYTMIFRVMMYVVNTLLRHFMSTDISIRESSKFRLPPVIPIVFYNGKEKWTALKSLKDYQQDGSIFGDYVLNLKYYLIDLSELEEEYILNTNTVIDNIMYCDKFRERAEIINALNTAYKRINTLNPQDIESFDVWAHNILLNICKDKSAIASELLTIVKKGDDNMGDFKHGWLLQYEEDRANAIAEGLKEGLQQGLEQGLEQGLKQGLKQGLIETCNELGLSREDTLTRLIEKFSLSEEPANELMQKYWK